MKITNFKDMYIAELQEMVSMEGQLADELPRMAEVATHRSLKRVLTHHREETQIQRERLVSILQKHGANPRTHTDQAMLALVNETEMMLGMLKGKRGSRCGAYRIGSKARTLRDRSLWHRGSSGWPARPAQ